MYFIDRELFSPVDGSSDIDFGFMLSNSPGNIGKYIGLRCRLPALTLRQGFEAAPFKLPSEYVEVLGGIDSELFREFKRLFRHGFEAARKHCDRIISQLTQFICMADEINFSQPL